MRGEAGKVVIGGRAGIDGSEEGVAVKMCDADEAAGDGGRCAKDPRPVD